MLQKEIQSKLFQWQDLAYRSFQIKLIPNLAATTIDWHMMNTYH